MHISKLTLVNYRNFKNTTLQFHKGVNTIIGENGPGKSNILRAIRLLLDDTMVRQLDSDGVVGRLETPLLLVEK